MECGPDHQPEKPDDTKNAFNRKLSTIIMILETFAKQLIGIKLRLFSLTPYVLFVRGREGKRGEEEIQK